MATKPIRALSAVMAKAKASSSDLYRQLSRLGKASSGEVERTMNKWVREGKSVKKYEIDRYVKELRKFKRHSQALELMDWMKSRGTNFSYTDSAVHIDLLSKAKGISAAEEYFESLPEPAKNRLTYGALLNCYCHEKKPDEALALLNKMKELNMASTYLAYNNLMSLYTKLHQPEKVPPLFHEMKDKKIAPDTFTYNVVMHSYALLKDIEAAEKVVDEMKEEGNLSCDWTTYSTLASIYIAAGDFEKADVALERFEENINDHEYRDRQAFHFLISLYAKTGNLAGVKRAFKSLKSAFPRLYNSSYLVMLQSLAKLDDFDGLRQCFEEWESGCVNYDVRLANVLIYACLRRDMIEEAKLLYKDAVAKGSCPNHWTQEKFIDFYLRNNQIDSAMQHFDTAATLVTTKDHAWQPSQEKVRAFLKHFEESKDVDGAENFYEKLKKVNYLDLEVYTSLLRTYIAAGQTEPLMRQRMVADKIEINPGTEELLQKVCPMWVL